MRLLAAPGSWQRADWQLGDGVRFSTVFGPTAGADTASASTGGRSLVWRFSVASKLVLCPGDGRKLRLLVFGPTLSLSFRAQSSSSATKFPFLVLWPPEDQALAGNSLQPGQLGAAGTGQALPGRDRCKSSGSHMKKSC
jgi:hypothetical protein